MPYKDKKIAYERRKAGQYGKAPLTANSMRHVALLYMKMRRVPIDPLELTELNSRLFARQDRTRAALKALADRGFATAMDGKYQITQKGFDAVYSMANRRKLKPEDAD